MRLEKINSYNPNVFAVSSFSKKNSEAPNYNTNIETSIYNEKGLNVSFGCLAKGQDAVEETCIRLLRKVREGRRRKFAEDDIMEIINDLRGIGKKQDKQNILEEILTLEDENTGSKADKKVIKNVIKLISGKPEDERYGVLEYAMNDLKNGVEPLEAFANLPKEKQDKLIKILSKINDVNEKELFISEKAKDETLDSLYDYFRVVLYADDDLSRLDISKADAYKIDKVNLLNQDRKYFNNLNSYSSTSAKQKIITVTNKVLDYFLDNIN